MRTFFSIYKNCIKTAFAGATAYRLNFILSLLIALGFNALFPIVTVLIYNNGLSFPGWSFTEILLIQSIFLMSSGLAHMMFNGVLWSTMNHIREGSFETVLLKPINPLFFLIASNFDAECIGMIIGGSAMFGVSVYFVGIASLLSFMQFLLLFAAGFCVMAGTNMITAAIAFKWVGNSRLEEIFDSLMTFGKYPVTIFPKAIQSVATFAIPVSMVGFFPAQALLGNAELLSFIAVIPSGLFMMFGIWLYLLMVKHYEGVGG